MNMGFVDYYRILDVNPTNDIQVIKKAYKKLAKLTHPDVNGTGDDTEFKKIQDAYDNLKSEEMLNKYYNYYKKCKEKINTSKTEKEVNKDSYEEFKMKYEEYIVKKSKNNQKKKENINKSSKKKNNKLNVFLNNFKKGNYILRTAKVASILTILIGLSMTNVKKQNDDMKKDISVQSIQKELNNDISTYELIRNYEVQKGDTLYDLAIEIGTSVDKIKKNNNLENDTIYYNDIIRLPYEVLKEDLDYYTTIKIVKNNSIFTLAEKYNTTIETIYNLNREAIIKENDNYYILSDTLKVPNFLSQKELDNLKNSKNAKFLNK